MTETVQDLFDELWNRYELACNYSKHEIGQHDSRGPRGLSGYDMTIRTRFAKTVSQEKGAISTPFNRKTKKCPYCHEFTEWSSDTEDDASSEKIHVDEGKSLVSGAWVSASLARTDDGRIGLYVSGDDNSWRQIKFCPMCGRRLEEE